MSALVFRERTKGTGLPCQWPTCPKQASGRFFLTIAGHPVTNAHGEHILICSACKDSLEEQWDDLLRNAPLQTNPEPVGAL